MGQAVSDHSPLSNARSAHQNDDGEQVQQHGGSSTRASEGNTGSRLTIIRHRGLRRLSVITLPDPVGSDDEDGQRSSSGAESNNTSTKADERSVGNTLEGFESTLPYSAT